MSKTTWAARTAKFAVLATVFAAGGTGVAVAGSTTGSGGVGSGNQVSVPLSISATICGNAIALLGDAFGGCESAASASSASHSSTSHHNASHNSAPASGAAAGSQTTSGSHSIAGGNQVSAPVSVPVTVCGNAAAVLGRGMGGCEPAASASGAAASSQTTSGSHSIAGGNQVSAPVNAPVTVCGNSLSVAGRAESSCAPGGAPASGAAAGSQTTSGSHSIAGGNQVSAPVNVPVTVCGNAAAVLGRAMGGCEPAASASGAAASSQTTSGSHSIAGGNQVSAPVNAPVTVCGNSLSVAGRAESSCAPGGAPASGAAAGSQTTSGSHSIAGGNQVSAPVNAPVTVCGNAPAVLGRAMGGCEPAASASGAAASSQTTSG